LHEGGVGEGYFLFFGCVPYMFSSSSQGVPQVLDVFLNTSLIKILSHIVWPWSNFHVYL
jgi:hypothetical protein